MRPKGVETCENKSSPPRSIKNANAWYIFAKKLGPSIIILPSLQALPGIFFNRHFLNLIGFSLLHNQRRERREVCVQNLVPLSREPIIIFVRPLFFHCDSIVFLELAPNDKKAEIYFFSLHARSSQVALFTASQAPLMNKKLEWSSYLNYRYKISELIYSKYA